jgi:hypothetical protein
MAGQPSYPGTPTWAKVFWVVIAVAILLFLAMLLIGGPHGPRRHGGDDGSRTRTAATVERPPGSAVPA